MPANRYTTNIKEYYYFLKNIKGGQIINIFHNKENL